MKLFIFELNIDSPVLLSVFNSTLGLDVGEFMFYSIAKMEYYCC